MSLSPELTKLINITEDVLTQQLIRDVKEIFLTMVGQDDLLHLPLHLDPMSHFSDCVSSLVGFAGTFNGLVSIHMPSELALKTTSGMLCMEVTEIDDDVRDALGEIGNMIAGSFKQYLSKSGTDIQLSTPSVVTGKEYMISVGDSPEHLAIKFATDEEWFMVSVVFEFP